MSTMSILVRNRVSEIEDAVAANTMTAEQVFTQMRQLLRKPDPVPAADGPANDAVIIPAFLRQATEPVKREDLPCNRCNGTGRFIIGGNRTVDGITHYGYAVPCKECSGAGAPNTQVHDRETLGRIVREVWIEWANEQPNPKASWLVPWDGLSEPDKEVDRRIGERLAAFAMASSV